jgi:signal transduction histidine kinase
MAITAATSLILCIVSRQQRLFEQRKDEFIRMASHELKTPLTSLKIYLQLLSRSLHPTTKKTITHLNKIDDQVNKLTELTEDLLDLSKIQVDRLELRKRTFPINELLRETKDTLQMTTTKHKITLNNRSRSKIFADRERISQVIVNLITNAIKYSPKGGKIIIKSGSDGENLIVSVQDFGIGIATKFHDRLFDAFSRIDDVVKKGYPGFGIGLYISSEIVKKHNGKIWVKSKKGKGSTFLFSLPLAKNIDLYD